MTSVTLDEKAIEALKVESGVVAVTDAAGNVVGFYAPVKQEYAEQYAEMAARASVGYANGRRAMTTPEVVAWLNTLEPKQ